IPVFEGSTSHQPPRQVNGVVRVEEDAMRILVGACLFVVASTAWADKKADDVAAVRKAIAAQNAKYVEAVNKQDVPAFLALFTDDATLLYAGKTVKGKKAREEAAKVQVAAVKDPLFKTTEVDVRSDLAYEEGEYTVTARAGGKKTSGTYLVIWKRQKDGAWKIHVEATLPGTSDER